MSILLSDISFAVSQAHWTYSGLCQQAHGCQQILQLTNCSPQTTLTCNVSWANIATSSHVLEHFSFVEQCSTAPPILWSEQFCCGFLLCTLYAHCIALYILYSHNCKELQVVHCSLFACRLTVCLRGGHTNFDVWTSACVIVTPVFVFFTDYCHNCCSDYCYDSCYL